MATYCGNPHPHSSHTWAIEANPGEPGPDWFQCDGLPGFPIWWDYGQGQTSKAAQEAVAHLAASLDLPAPEQPIPDLFTPAQLLGPVDTSAWPLVPVLPIGHHRREAAKRLGIELPDDAPVAGQDGG
jgi:hypothetical protein